MNPVMSSTSKPTILFLGATGGCALASLTHTLNAGYNAIALVRTPSKLTSLLTARGISESTLSSLLTIHSGNARSVAAVKAALLITSPDGSVRLPNTIISGLGAAPKLAFSLNLFTLDDPTICQTAAATLVAALNEIYSEHPQLSASKPLLSFISTTGITRGPEDVPFWMRFLYHWVLHVPHLDKRGMEDVFRDTEPSPFRSVVGIRPTLLTDGQGVGAGSLRAGKEDAPALGYTVTRADVGEWIFRNVVETHGKGWEGEMVSLTS